MGFGFWLASYAGDTVDWRGEKYRLLPGGRMIRQEACAVAAPAKDVDVSAL